jgi:hypothetical protein
MSRSYTPFPPSASMACRGTALPLLPIVQEAGWASEPVWTQRLKEKSFASAGEFFGIALIFYSTNYYYLFLFSPFYSSPVFESGSNLVSEVHYVVDFGKYI